MMKMKFFKSLYFLTFAVVFNFSNAKEVSVVARVDSIAITNIDVEKAMEMIQFLDKKNTYTQQKLKNEALRLLIEQSVQMRYFELVNIDIQECVRESSKDKNTKLKNTSFFEEFINHYCTKNIWNHIVSMSVKKNYKDLRNVDERRFREESEKIMKQAKQRFLIEVF